ncbi:hypothetical protein GF377_02225 [candidate division GN15 bacterium]|nr:hypothetical protein [candidate division GN15 bacterium]
MKSAGCTIVRSYTKQWPDCWTNRWGRRRRCRRDERGEDGGVTSRLVRQSLLSATLFTVGGNILGRAFGFLREAVFASYLGTSALFDTFLLAFTLPELIAMVLFQALPVSLIPTASSTATEKDRESHLFWSGLVWFGVGFGVVSLALYLGRDWLFDLLASELSDDRVRLGTQLLGLLAPYVFFRGLEAYFRSWCFAKKHFVAPATSNIIINATVMAAVVFFYEDTGIVTLAYGWILGSIILMLYNGLSAFRLVRPSLRLAGENIWVTTLWRSLLAVAVVESISMIYPLIDRYFAAEFLGPGPISALRYASTLISLPTGVFVAAFNVASFPWIAELSGKRDTNRLRELYVRSTRLLLFGMAVTAVGIVVFAEDIVRVAFQRGAFDADSLALTTAPLQWYALGLVFQAVYTFQLRFYYVRQVYLRIGVILGVMLVVKLLLSRLLIGPMEHHGLALATSAARLLGFTILTIDLARVLSVSHRDLFGRFVGPLLVALMGASGTWFLIDAVWQSATDWSLWAVFGRLVLVAVAGTGVYVLVGQGLGLKEPRAAWRTIRDRIGARR